MKYFDKLKTSDKISLRFSLFNFISLIILLFSINVVYFFVWYENQKVESLYDVNVNYDSYTGNMSDDNIEAFKKYILTKDSIIIPNDSNELICSPGILKKVHNNVEKLKGKYFYRIENKIYFIFSKNYKQIGEVKVLFDTTSYIHSQIMIIKISLIIIFISLFIYYLIGKTFSKYALKDLKKISDEAKQISIENNFRKIEITGADDDEIKILAETINSSFEKIARQTNNLKQFITDVSHEFKTPLMIINSKIDLYNKMLEKGTCGEKDYGELLNTIKSKTKKLDKLLETLFLFSRFQEGIICFEKKEVNLSKCLKSLVNSLVLSLDDKKVNVSYSIESDIYKDIEDSTFSILVENLIINAIKFSSKEANIEVGLNEKGFWVKDKGVGINKKDLNKIWNKFYRNDLNKQGFGIGLFIVKRVCDIYLWTPKVDSEVGKGTKFTINF